MAAQKGKLFLLSRKVAGSPVTYQAFANARATDMTINGEVADVTTKAADGWRVGLEGADIKSMSISLEGVFNKDTQNGALITAAMNGTHADYKLESGAGDTVEGKFQVTSYSRGGAQSGEETFSATFESVGVVSYSAGT